MRVTKIPPSNAKTITDKDSGIKYSDRDITVLTTCINPSSSLISFGTEIYSAERQDGTIFLIYNNENKGKGFVAYTIGDVIEVSDVYADCISVKEELIAYEALVETVYNMSKSSGKNMIVNSDNPVFERYIDNLNQSYKEKKLEDKYKWNKE